MNKSKPTKNKPKPTKLNNNKKRNRRQKTKSRTIVSAPTIIGTTTNLKQKPIRFSRREFVSDIVSGGVTRQNYRVVRRQNGLITSIASFFQNVGLTKSFPWLSSVADGFEKFLFHTLSFNYVPTCATSTPGALTMSFNSNPAKPETSNEESAYSTKSNSIQTSVWKPGSLKIPVKKIQETTKSKLVRNGPIKETEDINLTDLGIVDVVTTSNSESDAVVPLGKLYVDYDVELINPKLGTGDNIALYADHSYAVSSSTTNWLGYVEDDSTILANEGVQYRVYSIGDDFFMDFRLVKPSQFYLVSLSVSCVELTVQPTFSYENCLLDSTIPPSGHFDTPAFNLFYLLYTDDQVSWERLAYFKIYSNSTSATYTFFYNLSVIEIDTDVINNIDMKKYHCTSPIPAKLRYQMIKSSTLALHENCKLKPKQPTRTQSMTSQECHVH